MQVWGETGGHGATVGASCRRYIGGDRLADNIQRAHPDGSSVEELVPGLIGLRSIALDMAILKEAAEVYWVDSGTDKIQRTNPKIPPAQSTATRTDIDDFNTGEESRGAQDIALDIRILSDMDGEGMVDVSGLCVCGLSVVNGSGVVGAYHGL